MVYLAMGLQAKCQIHKTENEHRSVEEMIPLHVTDYVFIWDYRW